MHFFFRIYWFRGIMSHSFIEIHPDVSNSYLSVSCFPYQGSDFSITGLSGLTNQSSKVWNYNCQNLNIPSVVSFSYKKKGLLELICKSVLHSLSKTLKHTVCLPPSVSSVPLNSVNSCTIVITRQHQYFYRYCWVVRKISSLIMKFNLRKKLCR